MDGEGNPSAAGALTGGFGLRSASAGGGTGGTLAAIPK